jgi:hypothetical protein
MFTQIYSQNVIVALGWNANGEHLEGGKLAILTITALAAKMLEDVLFEVVCEKNDRDSLR